jgi:hypothetical protein
MTKIYAVGVIKAEQLETKPFIKELRLWYLFHRFEDAEKCVLENQSDIFEFYYDFACIEEVYVHDYANPPKEGEETYIPKQWWYKINYFDGGDHKDDIVEKIDQPERMNKVCCIWVG